MSASTHPENPQRTALAVKNRRAIACLAGMDVLAGWLVIVFAAARFTAGRVRA